MRKFTIIALVAALTAVPVVLFSRHFGIATARANLHPVGASGISANIVFVDDGSTLGIAGLARGLDPNDTYVSNIYDRGSLPGGPKACVPTIFPPDPDSIVTTMFIGVWTVNPDGTGHLLAVNTNGGADYIALGKFRTISVRNASLGRALQACGRVAVHPG